MLVDLNQAKVVLTIPPIDANGTSPTSTAIDTTGYGGVFILFSTGNVAADMTALKITECETSGGTYTDVSGTDISSVGTLPLGTGGDNKVSAFFIKRDGHRKLYLEVACTAGAGATLVSAVAILVSPTVAPLTATAKGLANAINIG